MGREELMFRRVLLAGTFLAMVLAPAVPAQAVTRDCNDKPATKVGTAGNDTITTGSAADVIVSLAGDDTVTSDGGPDTICTGRGFDHVVAAGGNDEVFGGPDADYLNGARGADFIQGQAGNDSMYGEAGNDTLYAVDQEYDYLNCGLGDFDQVYIDQGLDFVEPSCEIIN
jgi:Ca2+-binding RTX toxin-like protein